MTPERYAKIDEMVADALELESIQREAFITRRCGDDPLLRHEVESWIAAHLEADKQDFLASPAIADYTQLLGSDQERQHGIASSEIIHAAPDQDSLHSTYNYLGMLLKERYLVEKELGHGNIGVVYMALDRQLHSRPVAIKVLLEKSLKEPWYKKKMAQEIEVLALIDHPGIVEVFDRGETPDGNPFLVMKFISGQTLRLLMKKERLELKQVAQIIRQTGQALSAAHEQGVVHCDLKPENIMIQTLVGSEQQIKIVDFGVAKVRKSEVAEESDETFVAGTPSYMAPEHIDGFPTSASDIFSFGIIAYELLTGVLPFPGMLAARKGAIRLGPEKKPKDLRPEVSTAAQGIILKALSFEQNDRYGLARDFGELLAQALTMDLELPSMADTSESVDIVMVHILFIDIVGYSKLSTDDQSQIYKELQVIVSRTDTFRNNKATGQVISRSTGDGVALVFYSSPKAPIQCALEIARAVRSDAHFQLRMGINSGPVYRVKDMNGAEDVAGAGINMAQRVMDCGDAGHILISKSAADVLKELADWRDRLHDLGEHSVKHGTKVHLFNVYGSDVGNKNLPERLRKSRAWYFALAAVILVTITVAALALQSSSGTVIPFISQPPVPSEVERSLSYSVRVQKYRDGRPTGGPIQLTGPDRIFEKEDRLKLSLTSGQLGYFYVLNEPPARSNTIPELTALHASTKSSDQASPLNLEFPDDVWLKFEGPKGTEKLWLVWSAKKVEALEAVKGLDNPQDNGRITDPNLTKAAYAFIKEHSASKPVVAEDKEQKLTRIKAKGEVLVYPLELEHK